MDKMHASLFFLALVLLGSSEPQVEQEEDSQLYEQQVQQNTAEILGELFGVAPELETEDEPMEPQEVGKPESDSYQELDTVQGLDTSDIVQLVMEMSDCSQEEVDKCFDALGGDDFFTMIFENQNFFCNKAPEVIQCGAKLAEKCTDEGEKETVQNSFEDIKENVKNFCEEDEESEEGLETIALDTQKCLQTKINFEDVMSDCGPQAFSRVQEDMEKYDLTKSDALCLSYINVISCTADIAEEKCGSRIADFLYKELLSVIDIMPELKESDFCSWDEDYEVNNEQQITALKLKRRKKRS